MEKNKLMMIIIIALLVILIVVIGLVSFFFMKSMTAKPEGEKAEVPEITQEVVKLSQHEITTIKLGDALSTNLLTSTDGSKHIIRITLSIGVNNSDKKLSPDFIKMMEEKQTVLRDITIGVLSNKTIEEIERPEGLSVLKSDIKEKMQEEFNSNLIVEVYLDDKFVQ